MPKAQSLIDGKIGIRVRNVTFQRMVYRFYSLFSSLGLRLNIKKPYVFHRYNFTASSLHLLLQRTGFKYIQIINSPLTEGDPYTHMQIKEIISTLKDLVDAISRFFFMISKGCLIIGPSLLVWAEKR